MGRESCWNCACRGVCESAQGYCYGWVPEYRGGYFSFPSSTDKDNKDNKHDEDAEDTSTEKTS